MDDIIKINNLSYAYESKKVFSEVNLTINSGDFAALIGPNGSGKSTFIKLLLGILPCQQGEINLLGDSINKFKAWDKVGYIPQDIREFNHSFPATVKEIIAANLYQEMGFIKILTTSLEKKIDKALEKVNMLEYKSELIGQLSGGQQQRVFIARTLVTEPEIIFLDEPLAGVDASAEESFYNLLAKLNNKFGITIIMISHNVNVVSNKANKIICFGDEKIYSHQAENFDYSRYIKEIKNDKAIILPHSHHERVES